MLLPVPGHITLLLWGSVRHYGGSISTVTFLLVRCPHWSLTGMNSSMDMRMGLNSDLTYLPAIRRGSGSTASDLATRGSSGAVASILALKGTRKR